MKFNHSRLTPFLLAGFMATTGVHNALALEAEDVATRLKDVFAQQQAELSYDSARLDGNDVVLEGVTVRGNEAEEDFPLGTLTLQDVSERQDGSFLVGTLAIDDLEHQEEDITITLADMVVSDLILPAEGAEDPFGGVARYGRMEIAQFDVQGKDGSIASASNIYASTETSEEDLTMDASGGVEAFSLNLGSLVEEGKGAAMLKELGYEEISGSAVMEGTWHASDGRLTLSQYEMTVDDAGALTVELDLAGYTPEFIRSLEELAQQDGGDGDMQGMAMMGLMQQLTFHGAAIGFTDDSLAGKVLDYMADQQGGSSADIIAQAKAAIPPQLTPFVGADLAGNIAQAVSAFLENPDNIQISARPESPLPFVMLVGAAMASPEMLVQQIGLTVEANQ